MTGAPFPETHLAARELAIGRGDLILAEDMTFTLESGDAMLVKGPNGSGKSTFLRVMAGLMRPFSGRIDFDRTDIGGESHYATHLHAVFAANAIKPLCTVGEQLTDSTHIAGGPRHIAQALDMLGLLPLEHRLIRTLSTGQRRRVALARLVANPRPVWILDEPELGLDRTNRALVDSLIRKHREDGGIVMVASHHIEHIDGCLEINFADAA